MTKKEQELLIQRLKEENAKLMSDCEWQIKKINRFYRAIRKIEDVCFKALYLNEEFND